MTKNSRFLPSGRRTKRMLFVVLADAVMLDVVGPLEAFHAANEMLRRSGTSPLYELEVAAAGGHCRSAAGLQVVGTPLCDATAAHTLIIGGTLSLPVESERPDWLLQLGRLASKAQRVVSVCTAAFVLGELGLLAGKRCTSHWIALDELRQRYPDAQVENDALYTQDGQVYTSAGCTAGIDLALHLIEQDLGSKMALTVARLLVVFLRRPGGQSQFSASLSLRRGGDQRISDLIAEIVERIGEDHHVNEMARRVGMSPRHFARVFREQTGQTPAAFVSKARLEAARNALELSDDPLAAVAATCGFGSEETLRRVFQRNLGVHPGAYRRRFHQHRHVAEPCAS